jgi:hypothetical protein
MAMIAARQQGMGTPTPQGGMNQQAMNRMQVNGGQMQGMNGGSPGAAMMGMPGQTSAGVLPQFHAQVQQAMQGVQTRAQAQYQQDLERRKTSFMGSLRARGQAEPTPEQLGQFQQQEQNHKHVMGEKLTNETAAINATSTTEESTVPDAANAAGWTGHATGHANATRHANAARHATANPATASSATACYATGKHGPAWRNGGSNGWHAARTALS